MPSKEKALGQYITPTSVVNLMVSLITHPTNSKILEPSAGNGAFLNVLREQGFNHVDAFEIDSTLASMTEGITVTNFLELEIEEEYEVVIGNPPYVRWKYLDERLKQFLETHEPWKSIFNHLSDLSFAFIYSGVRALKNGGELIYISPLFWQNAHHGRWLRQYLLDNGYLDLMIDLGEMRLFSNANLHFIIFRYKKTKRKQMMESCQKSVLVCKIRERKMNLGELERVLKLMRTKMHSFKLDYSEVGLSFEERLFPRHLPIELYLAPHPRDANPWIFMNPEQLRFTTTLEQQCQIVAGKYHVPILVNKKKRKQNSSLSYVSLGHIATIANGLVSGLDKAFRFPRAYLSLLHEFETKHLLKIVKARDLERYRAKKYSHYIFLNDVFDEKCLKQKAPIFYRHLLPYKERLLQRYSYGKELPWWHWAFLRSFQLFSQPVPKIFVPCKERVSHRGYVRFALIPAGVYPTQDMTVIVPHPSLKESIQFILGLLSSDVWFKWLQAKGHIRGGVLEFSEKPLERIPIRLIDWSDLREVELHDEITTMVQEIIDEGFSSVKQNSINKLVLDLLDLSS